MPKQFYKKIKKNDDKLLDLSNHDNRVKNNIIK